MIHKGFQSYTAQQSTDRDDAAGKVSEPTNDGAERASEFPTLNSTSSQPAQNTPRALSFFSDVELPISAELGRTTVTIRKLLSLGVGSILTLQEAPTATVTLRAHGKTIASGEVVTINDRFGVRVNTIEDNEEPGAS